MFLYYIFSVFKVEKSQGEIYRLRAKLENTQSENENIQEEFDKIQQALSRSVGVYQEPEIVLKTFRSHLNRSLSKVKNRVMSDLRRLKNRLHLDRYLNSFIILAMQCGNHLGCLSFL